MRGIELGLLYIGRSEEEPDMPNRGNKEQAQRLVHSVSRNGASGAEGQEQEMRLKDRQRSDHKKGSLFLKAIKKLNFTLSTMRSHCKVLKLRVDMIR